MISLTLISSHWKTKIKRKKQENDSCYEWLFYKSTIPLIIFLILSSCYWSLAKQTLAKLIHFTWYPFVGVCKNTEKKLRVFFNAIGYLKSLKVSHYKTLKLASTGVYIKATKCAWLYLMVGNCFLNCQDQWNSDVVPLPNVSFK